MFKHLEPQYRNRSIITYRGSIKRGITKEVNLVRLLTRSRMVHIPWCNNFVYAHWLRLLAGDADVHVFPQYFFSTCHDSNLEIELQKWTDAFAHLKIDLLLTDDKKSFINCAWLENHLGIFGTDLWRSSIRLFGVPPGKVMRTCRIFILFVECMRREMNYYERYGKRRSALPDMPGDFRRSLQRVFGVSYSEIWKKNCFNSTLRMENLFI